MIVRYERTFGFPLAFWTHDNSVFSFTLGKRSYPNRVLSRALPIANIIAILSYHPERPRQDFRQFENNCSRTCDLKAEICPYATT